MTPEETREFNDMLEEIKASDCVDLQEIFYSMHMFRNPQFFQEIFEELMVIVADVLRGHPNLKKFCFIGYYHNSSTDEVLNKEKARQNLILAAVLSNPTLTTLEISGSLYLEAAATLAQGIRQSTSLKALTVGLGSQVKEEPNVTTSAFNYLAEAIAHSRSIEKLTCSFEISVPYPRNHLFPPETSASLKYLLQHNASITEICIGDAREVLNEEDQTELVNGIIEGLSTNSTIKKVVLIQGRRDAPQILNTDFAIKVAEFLGTNSTIQEFHLEGDFRAKAFRPPLTASAAKAFAAALQNNYTLLKLTLPKAGPASKEAMETIQALLERNNQIHLERLKKESEEENYKEFAEAESIAQLPGVLSESDPQQGVSLQGLNDEQHPENASLLPQFESQNFTPANAELQAYAPFTCALL